MIRSPFNCTEIGKWLAQADDEQQAELINAFAKELPIVCKAGGGGATASLQLCYMSDHLDQHGRELIKELMGYVKMREDGP